MRRQREALSIGMISYRLAQGWSFGLLFLFWLSGATACELCAIYGADNAREDTGRGFLFTIAEMYTSAETLQAEGNSFNSVPFLSQAYLDTSITHFVPGYNFSSRFGLSVNVPMVYRDFHRTELLTRGPPFSVEERGTIIGLGDTALVARFSPFQKIEMNYAVTVNLLAGVKFPTGDTDRLDAEVQSAREDLAIFGPNHAHGTIGGVHQHDLSFGSGSYDGVFAVTGNARWKRWILNSQIQYYLRTEARGYEFGDEIIVSGGPGGYLLLKPGGTLSLQANAFYESSARDRIIGQAFDQTGMTAWYLGPLLTGTIGEHFSANFGIDVPLRIYNHGLQTVPDLRVRAGVSWKF